MAVSMENWFSTLGPITKATLCAIVALAIGISTSSVMGGATFVDAILVDLERTVWKLQLWRLLTACYILGKPSFGWFFQVAMLVIYTRYHEDMTYRGKRADMIWMLFILIITIHCLLFGVSMVFPSVVGSIVYLGPAMINALCWTFCKRNPGMKMSLYMFEFPAAVFPFVLLAFNMVLTDFSPVILTFGVIGFLSGHIFLFLKDIIPATQGHDYVPTPRFLRQWFPDDRAVTATVAGRTLREPNQAPEDQGVHRWGRGRVLGAQ
mmetsp:Transcript_28873/g.33344  ORF Transcript_28873/g.33344 Transcript_28873/m.33344 type:complete len:264 (+) Transcript_28873:57-848(+)